MIRLALLLGLAVLAHSLAHAARAPKLADQLLSNDRATRLKAVEVFNGMPSDKKYQLVPDLMVALSSPDPAVRQRATKILNVMGVKAAEATPDAKATLPEVKKDLPARADEFATLESDDDPVTEDRRGPAGYDDMRRMVREEKQASGFLDPRELGMEEGGSAGLGSPLVAALKDPDPMVRARAARRLGSVRPPPLDSIPVLIDLLSDPDKEVRASAAGALGGFGPEAKSAVPALSRMLADEDPALRPIAAEALKQIQANP